VRATEWHIRVQHNVDFRKMICAEMKGTKVEKIQVSLHVLVSLRTKKTPTTEPNGVHSKNIRMMVGRDAMNEKK